MSNQCEPLFAIREEFVKKYEAASNAIDSAADSIVTATIALAAAEASIVTCLLAPPLTAACVVGVGIAIGAAWAALAYYESKLEEAHDALNEALAGIEEVDKLLSHCQELASWQTEAAEELVASAPDPDHIAVPEIDDTELSEVEDALAAVEDLDLEGTYA